MSTKEYMKESCQLEAKMVRHWLEEGVPSSIKDLDKDYWPERLTNIERFIGHSSNVPTELLLDFFEYSEAEFKQPMTPELTKLLGFVKRTKTESMLPVPIQEKYFAEVAEEWAKDRISAKYEEIFSLLGKRIPKDLLKGEETPGEQFTLRRLLPELSAYTAEIQEKVSPNYNLTVFGDEIPKVLDEDPEDNAGAFWGINAFDEVTHGIGRGRIATVGAYTGEGKSTYTRYMAAFSSLVGRKGLYISLEMDAEEVRNMTLFTTINLACGTEFTQKKFGEGLISPKKIKEALEDIKSRFPKYQAPEFISPTDFFSVDTLDARISKKGYSWVVLDYLGLMDASRGLEKGAGFSRVLAFNFKKLKNLAMREHTAIIVPHQINREGAKKRDASGKYGLYDLGDSSGVERTSDHVLMISCPADLRAKNKAELALSKNRRGKTIEPFTVDCDLSTGIYLDNGDASDPDIPINGLELEV